jgi:hypothetical protein
LPEQAVEVTAKLFGPYLLGVRRTDGGNFVGELQTAFKHVASCSGSCAHEDSRIGRDIRLKKIQSGEITLIGEIVDGEHALRFFEKRTGGQFQKIRCESAGPIMAMDYVGFPPERFAQTKRRLVLNGIPLDVIFIWGEGRIPVDPLPFGECRM